MAYIPPIARTAIPPNSRIEAASPFAIRCAIDHNAAPDRNGWRVMVAAPRTRSPALLTNPSPITPVGLRAINPSTARMSANGMTTMGTRFTCGPRSQITRGGATRYAATTQINARIISSEYTPANIRSPSRPVSLPRTGGADKTKWPPTKASIASSKAVSDPVMLPSFHGIRLVLRSRPAKRFVIQTRGIDSTDERERLQVDFEAQRVGNLRHQAYVRQTRRVAMAIDPGATLGGQTFFQGSETGAYPMRIPGQLLLLADTDPARKVVEHARIVER